MTLWPYFALCYFVVAAVFAVLLSTSEEWRDAVDQAPLGRTWLGAVIQFAMLAGFGCMWPAVALYWLFA